MPHKLAVVLGAGASFDSVPSGHEGVLLDPTWRPPLVSNLFAGGALDAVLKDHPEAQTLFSSIRARSTSNWTLEKSLAEQVTNPNINVQRLLKYVPIALYDFFLRLSEQYTTEAINYSALINRTVCSGFQTAFITVNYDTLLERSLSKSLNASFGKVDSYTNSSPDWLLAKLHGSVGWGYPWQREGKQLRQTASTNDLPDRLSSNISVGLPPGLRIDRGLHYPALALPVPGKTDFICPPQHVASLRSFLADCQAVLFVGFSANDPDVLELLRESLPRDAIFQYHVAAGRDAESVRAKLVQQVPQLRMTYPDGAARVSSSFTNFLSGSADEFLDTVRTYAGLRAAPSRR